MAIRRKMPHVILLDNFESAAQSFRRMVKLCGTSPAWTEKEVDRARYALQSAGVLVRRMQLTPEQRDVALIRLEKLSKWLKPLMTTHSFSIMNGRWITTIIRHVGAQ